MMTFPIAEQILIQTLIRPFAASLLLSVIFSLLFSVASIRQGFVNVALSNFVQLVGFGSPILFLAYIVGYLTGISRSSAVGNLIPAVLTLIAGLALYVFGTERAFKVIIGYCVLVFAVGLLYGAQTGSLEREIGREARIRNLSQQEKRIRDYRYNLELDEAPPAWILPRDDK